MLVIDKLGAELSANRITSHEEVVNFVDRHIQKSASTDDGKRDRLKPQWLDLKDIIKGAIGSALGALTLGAGIELLGALKSDIGSLRLPEKAYNWPVWWVNGKSSVDWTLQEDLFRRMIIISNNGWGKDSDTAAYFLSALARCLDDQEKYGEARPLHEQVFGIEVKNHGLDHINTGVALINLALNIYYQKRYADATPLFKRGLRNVEAARGADHIDTAAALYDLAVNLDADGRYDEADPLLRRALIIVEETSAKGPIPPDVKSMVEGEIQANRGARAREQRGSA